MSKLSVYLICTLREQKGKSDLCWSFQEEPCQLDTRCAGLQMPKAQEGKETQGEKASSPEASGVFSALALEGFEQCSLS